MSSKPQPSPAQPSRNVRSSQTFQRQKPKPGARVLTSEVILQDIADFKKRGGRIDVLGNTPLRTTTSAAFTSRSTAASKKPPTPIAEAGKSAS